MAGERDVWLSQLRNALARYEREHSDLAVAEVLTAATHAVALSPEPLPREALDVEAADRIAAEITRQRSADVQLSPLYAAGWEDAARFLRRLAARSPDRPTPP